MSREPCDLPERQLDEESLFQLAYEELHELAHRTLTRQDRGGTLHTTAVLHEAWLRIQGSGRQDFRDRAHYLAFASRAMRSVVVDHVRARSSAKRGGHLERFELDFVVSELASRSYDLVALSDLIDRLSDLDPQLTSIVEMKFFGGFSHAEIALSLHCSERSVERGWRTARAWLHARLQGLLEDESA